MCVHNNNNMSCVLLMFLLRLFPPSVDERLICNECVNVYTSLFNCCPPTQISVEPRVSTAAAAARVRIFSISH